MSPDSSAPSPDVSFPRVSRKPAKVVAAFDTAEGVDARVKRSIGTPGLWNPSPFLLLDFARIKPGPGGFPDHAHRGISTMTYVLEGEMQHEDFTGKAGRLGPGDVQWMTAGRGIMHSELPVFDYDADTPPVDAVALQLWIDLPAGKKMIKPSYQDKKASALAKATFPGGNVTVVSGESHGATGPVRPVAGCWFLDFRLESAGTEVWQPIPAGWTALVYGLTGTFSIGDDERKVEPHHAVLLSADSTQDGVLIRKHSGKAESRFVVIAGEPLDQPVVQQGPFVLTSREAAVQALRDLEGYKNGFERGRGWSSSIGNAKKPKGRR